MAEWKKRTIRIIFAVVCLVQIAIPLVIVFSAEKLARDADANNRFSRLLCLPRDPVDFLRGRYIDLRFDIEQVSLDKIPSGKIIEASSTKDFNGTEVYVLLRNEGDLHVIEDVVMEMPRNNAFFIRAKASLRDNGVMSLKYDFNRYYMQEDYAIEADDLLRGNWKDTLNLVLTIAADNSGRALQNKLELNGVRIEDYIMKHLEEKSGK
ncbi:MAG: hypothetical protein EHM28_00540 [Spirochaetaceae bacterium]|nr:MAG: hypothetical protein EHM28_00540 [Spirochaetaceae bacterium]